ncbi:CbtB-domain containing protein [Streptomyces adustus]|uniref:CbtB-domain containing protein n=1 Tax=Streptomyces adustus TaxID=1609272 RepID=A0A5N8VFS4_9ACTN|nr:CbtB-domain containing protein [Streptomyces adustus]
MPRRSRHGAVHCRPTPTTQILTPLPLGAIAPWAAFFGVLMLVLLYFVGAEQGATAVVSGEGVHEWVHDARHLLGFPCH